MYLDVVVEARSNLESGTAEASKTVNETHRYGYIYTHVSEGT